MKHLASRKFQLIDAFNDFVRPFQGERGVTLGRAGWTVRMKGLKMRSQIRGGSGVDSGEPIWIIGGTRLGVTCALMVTTSG